VADPDKFTILLADDSPVYRKMLEQSLAQENCALLLAKNGRDAIDLFTKHRPALVITDWTMPDISGIELCQRIRRDFEQCFAYLILVTSHSEKEQVIQGLAAWRRRLSYQAVSPRRVIGAGSSRPSHD